MIAFFVNRTTQLHTNNSPETMAVMAPTRMAIKTPTEVMTTHKTVKIPCRGMNTSTKTQLISSYHWTGHATKHTKFFPDLLTTSLVYQAVIGGLRSRSDTMWQSLYRIENFTLSFCDIIGHIIIRQCQSPTLQICLVARCFVPNTEHKTILQTR